MSFESKNFKFSSDIHQKSEDEFKAFMKVRYPQLRVKEIREIYKELHGYPVSIPTEVSED
jgi:hypothetical protein